jgi:Flp pilus assembly pilin Flp
MLNLAMRLIRDEAGFVVSTELILIATILVIGMITGLTTVRDQVVTELADVAEAVSNINQSYSWGEITAHCASTSASRFVDVVDFCDTAIGGANGTGDGACVVICGGVGVENTP